MIVLYIILMMIIVGGVGRIGYNHTPARALERSLSTPSRNLLQEYNAIPAESRPFPDLGSILKALDEKHIENTDALNKHFTTSSRRSYQSPPTLKFNWDSDSYCHGGRNRGCSFYDYYRLHKAFDDVKASLKEKERALRESRLKGSLDMIDELETRLREEIAVNNSFVDEFKKLG